MIYSSEFSCIYWNLACVTFCKFYVYFNSINKTKHYIKTNQNIQLLKLNEKKSYMNLDGCCILSRRSLCFFAAYYGSTQRKLQYHCDTTNCFSKMMLLLLLFFQQILNRKSEKKRKMRHIVGPPPQTPYNLTISNFWSLRDFQRNFQKFAFSNKFWNFVQYQKPQTHFKPSPGPRYPYPNNF